MADLAALLTDLAAEGAELDAIVSTVDDAGWRSPTPAPGWTIAHQIAHLRWTDRMAVLAATRPDAFAAELPGIAAAPTTFVDDAAELGARAPRAELLGEWRAGRAELAAALAALPAGARVPWFGPPMAPASMVTARIMETWAHGQDIADALGVERAPTGRLRHVAHLGVRTIGFAFATHGMAVPEPFRVALTGPAGEVWAWGDAVAANRIAGPALDFCLLVTQRRHPDDLDLRIEGADAVRWVTIAQAFAGPPGAGRGRSDAR